jgi:putative flippase GtrA
MLRHASTANQFARFLVAGGIAAAANFLSRIALDPFFGYAPAIVLAYFVGMATAYTLTRTMVFAPSGRSVGGEVLWFTIINVLAVLQTLVVSLFLADYALPRIGVIAGRKEVAHFFGIMVPAITSYLGHKHWTFRQK